MLIMIIIGILIAFTIVRVVVSEIQGRDGTIKSMRITLEAYEKEFQERFAEYNENHREG